jgi:RHS repeat-associated protein
MFTIGLSGTTWTAENQVQATDLFDVAYYATNAAYASGKDGRIYQNTAVTSTTSTWKLLPNNLKSKVSEIGFFDAQNGIALVDESGVKHLYRTFDGAKSWTMVSTEPFNELSMSSDRTLGLAVGNLGHAEVVVAGSSINVENIVLPFINQTSNFSAGWIARKSATEVYAMLAKTDGTIYSSSNILVQYPVWNTTTASTLLGGSPIQQIEGKLFSDTKVVSVVRTVSNKLVLLSKQSNSLLYAYSTLNLTSGDLFGGIAFDDVSGKVYTYNTASYKLGSIAISGGSLPTSITYSSATLTGNPIYTYLDVQGAGTSGTMIGIGASGLVSAVQFTSSTLAVNTNDNQMLRMTPIDLKTVDYLPTSGQVLAAGADGQVYVRATTGGAVWKALSTSRNTTLNDLKQAGTSLFAVGSDGVILFGSYTIGTQSTSLNEVTLSNGQFVSAQNHTKTFHSVAVSGNKVYAVGTSGIVAYSTDYTTTGFGISYQGNQDLYSIAQLPSSSAHYAVGVNARINSIQGGSFMKVNEIYTPIARDVHFMNTSTGTYLSDGFTLRSSNDGGVTWEVITPSNSNASTGTLVQNRVWTLSPTMRISVGTNMNSRIFNTNATDFTVSGVASVSTVYGKGLSLIVAGGNKVARLNFTPGFVMTEAALPSVGSSIVINGAYQFENNSYALVGNSGYFGYFSSTGLTITSGGTGITTDLYDLDFFDRSTGVLVGANGNYLRTNEQVIDANGYITLTDWVQQMGVGAVGVDPYDVQALSQVHIYSVAFVNATEGIYGGEYQSGFVHYSAPTHCFVRKFTDSYGRYTARFFYDKLGRLVVSQNSRQYNASAPNTPRKFSYTLYDALGRVVEVGEKSENSSSVAHFKSVFGTNVSSYFNPSVIDDDSLLVWIEGDGTRNEVTKSYYDATVIIGLPSTFDISEETQRKRITHVTYEAEYDWNDQTYDHATHYNYDIHGNVKSMLQDNRKMAMDFASLAGQRYKRLDYRYDLVSGNVHRMSVQSDSVDQWHHSYEYDADNRITNAYTNKNTPLLPIDASTASLDAELIANGDWEKDARYHYYEHGPLARVEIGNEQLQGVDYVYNLQGWMKWVNSSILDPAADPGKDGPSTGSGTGTSTGSGTANSTFAPDIVGFSLHYFNNDYAAIGGIGNAATIAAGSHADGNSAALYNGNIRYMQTAITDATITSGTTQNYAALPMLNAYQYDQLNRLKAARSYETGLASGIWNPTSYSNSYLNTFIYDAMGNIEYQDRYNRAGVQLEKMDYQYHETSGGDKISNRLYHINDLIDSLIASNDIDDQYAFTSHSTTTNINGSNNYVYDEEGRLIKDKAEEISSIVWRVDGKVKEINRPSTSTKKKLKFDYDAMGNRIAKHVFDNQTGLLERSTYYILDAQGNQLTTYEHVVDNSTANFVLKERHIFGSSRLGMLNEDVNVLTAQIEQNVQHEVGKKYYELSNHLGNVLSVFTDLKIPQSSNTVTVSSYRVFIAGTTDYSPFGVELDGRTQSPEAYRYSFNGMEKDDEVKGEGNSYDFGARMLDVRLGRWLSIDAYARKYSDLSPYHFAYCCPIRVIDPNGKENIIVASYDGGGNDKYKFINSALLQSSKNKNERSTEKTTILLMTFSMTEGQLEWVREEAKVLGVNLVEISKTEQIVNYINSGNILTPVFTEAREKDKVTDLSFFSHGYSKGANGSPSIEPAHGMYGSGSLEEGYDVNNRTAEQLKHDGYSFDKDDVKLLDPRAFNELSTCELYSCNSATLNANGESLVKSISNQLPETETSGYYGKTDYINIYGLYKGNEKVLPADYLPVGGTQSNGSDSFKVTYEGSKKK